MRSCVTAVLPAFHDHLPPADHGCQLPLSGLVIADGLRKGPGASPWTRRFEARQAVGQGKEPLASSGDAGGCAPGLRRYDDRIMAVGPSGGEVHDHSHRMLLRTIETASKISPAPTGPPVDRGRSTWDVAFPGGRRFLPGSVSSGRCRGCCRHSAGGLPAADWLFPHQAIDGLGGWWLR